MSRANEIRLPLLWIAVLHGHLNASLGATSNVERTSEVIKYLTAGADVAMTTSTLLRHGPGHIRTLVNETTAWMERREYECVRQMKGSTSQQKAEDPAAFERPLHQGAEEPRGALPDVNASGRSEARSSPEEAKALEFQRIFQQVSQSWE